MNIYDELENLKARARSNPELAQALLATREMKNPVSAFCRIAQEHGCTFSAMDLVSAGEDSYAAMRRSTNGGGVFIFLSLCVILEAKMEGYQDEGYLFDKLFC